MVVNWGSRGAERLFISRATPGRGQASRRGWSLPTLRLRSSFWAPSDSNKEAAWGGWTAGGGRDHGPIATPKIKKLALLQELRQRRARSHWAHAPRCGWSHGGPSHHDAVGLQLCMVQHIRRLHRLHRPTVCTATRLLAQPRASTLTSPKASPSSWHTLILAHIALSSCRLPDS